MSSNVYSTPLDESSTRWVPKRGCRKRLLVKKPSMFAERQELPADLEAVVRALEHDVVPNDFRGIPGQDVHRRLRGVGRAGKAPSRLKSFRFKPEDRLLLAQLAKRFELSETDVIRKALRALF